MNDLTALIDDLTPAFAAVSDSIWDFAELRFCEARSSAAQAALLERHGFRLTRNLAGMPTAFVAERGEGGPVIAFLGEFDALAGLSQKAGVAAEEALEPGGSGHGCGHNLLGVGAMLAATALARHLDNKGIAGTVRYYACPAEEGGSGKTFMAREGCFDDVDAAFTWHPAPFCGVRSTTNLSVLGIYYRFKGTAAHASNAPHLGRSALDALELMNVGVNFLREHMPSDARVHYAITDPGGAAPNVVQAQAEAFYYIRSPELPGAIALRERIDRIAKGAAMMTDTEVAITFDRATSNLLPNHALETALHATMKDLGPVPFDDADLEFAQAIRATLSDEAIRSSYKLYKVQGDALLNSLDRDSPLHRGLLAFDGHSHFRAGSTDVGDVSWTVPTAQVWTPCWAIGTPVHTWQVVAQGKSPGAHKAMVHAAKALALTALRACETPELLSDAKAEWAQRTNGQPYRCPLPPEIMPSVPKEFAAA
ncbi:M20 family metallopeptidase [Consotaella salsifontis]|uniref:Aminobenzoyl-glutamate utilization protein B n=1 Tax=Consotaella salsifontis TaxID=1365950 RepID=A0A1T4S8K4_9HYPH|nr:M20 family metallopeptidase [Consotaella salsifontis]SKA24497.1 aminobenzoyl-glutamate utilization protein B [Consotaella salsifontis]